MRNGALHRGSARAVAAAAAAGLVVLMTMGTAHAGERGSRTWNSADVNISGGDAQALAVCLNATRLAARHGRALQVNACKNRAVAEGGNVTLKNVDVTVLQDSGGRQTVNDANIRIAGGDATAVAACVNVMNGARDSAQLNKCANNAKAQGGDVSLKDVNITVVQGGNGP